MKPLSPQEAPTATQDLRRQNQELVKVQQHLARANQQLEREVAECRQVQEALQKTQRKYEGILDNVATGIALISPRLEILELNRQMRAWFPDIDPDLRPLCYQAFNDPPREAPCSYCPTLKTIQDGQVHEGTTATPVGILFSSNRPQIGRRVRRISS